MAETYLTEERDWRLNDWEEISASSDERPGGRVDHTFSWKQSDWDVGESQLRLSVTVQGDEIGYYSYWLKTPETFRRHFSEHENLANFINFISLATGGALLMLMTFLALWWTRGQLSPSFERALWAALAVAAVSGLAELNRVPLAKVWYNTTQDYWIFWVYRALGVTLTAVLNGGSVFILWLSSRWLSHRVWPRRDRVLARRGDRWRHLARSGWRGLMLGMMMGGYVVLFYLVTTQVLGGWRPLGPDYTTAYATPLLFLGALKTGLGPAHHRARRRGRRSPCPLASLVRRGTGEPPLARRSTSLRAIRSRAGQVAQDLIWKSGGET